MQKGRADKGEREKTEREEMKEEEAERVDRLPKSVATSESVRTGRRESVREEKGR